jgi:molybdopterin-guanine dinucleotide biosynthesis protein A
MGRVAHIVMSSVTRRAPMPDGGGSEVTGIILAGGESRRLRLNKALLELEGQPLLTRIANRLRPLCSDVVVVGGLNAVCQVRGLRFVEDLLPGHGALGGIHAGLHAAQTPYSLVVGCDMPFLNQDLLRFMVEQAQGYDAVILRLGRFLEPLHALYSRHCLRPIEHLLVQGGGRIISFFSQVRVRYIEEWEVDRFDPQHRSFFNINTPEDWQQAQRWVMEGIVE